jgi:hypothetical protein
MTALCQPAYGVVFRDKIKQVVGGNSLPLLHDVEDATSVRFGNPPNLAAQIWKFDTEGFSPDEAVITPSDSHKTLLCEEGSKCKLDPEGTKQPYLVTRVNETRPIFTFQDTLSKLYVSRTSDLYLELTSLTSDPIYFELEAVHGMLKIPVNPQ